MKPWISWGAVGPRESLCFGGFLGKNVGGELRFKAELPTSHMCGLELASPSVSGGLPL